MDKICLILLVNKSIISSSSFLLSFVEIRCCGLLFFFVISFGFIVPCCSSSSTIAMALSIGSVLYVLLLLINSLAILNEERFLAPIGWASIPQEQIYAHGIGQSVSVKAKIINLVAAVRTLLRIPLIIVNVVVIVYELILGSW
ncbi:Yos1-like-domain-containing protein [Syncephalis plumigaleata]|nr:Yos1-like-domain-containing protein [Syncephalis plumigaleata]